MIEALAQERTARAQRHIQANRAANLERFSENVIEVPEAERWRYAIPENYTNYQDGFMMLDGEYYRGRPTLDYNGELLYFWSAISWAYRKDDEDEKLLLFDRHGRRYTFIVRKADPPLVNGNPSYWEFIKRVKSFKRYKPPQERRRPQIDAARAERRAP